MAWQNYSILGGDITKDMQYEIIKLVGGATLASEMTLSVCGCRFANLAVRNTFLLNLAEIYNLCKSNNRIEETWNMQVLGLFVVDNALQTRNYIKRDSARVVWNHIKYELDNIDNFGWDVPSTRKDFVNNLYQDFGHINFAGGVTPFGLVTPPVVPTISSTMFINQPATIAPGASPIPVATPANYATIADAFNACPAPVAPAPLAPMPVYAFETINVSTGQVLPGQHTVVRTIRGWTKYKCNSKQWWCRVLATNRGCIVQTRWGKSWRRADALRVTTKAFGSERQALLYVNRTVATKQNNGYVLDGPAA